MRTHRLIIAIALTLGVAASARADAGNDLSRLLRDYRQAERAITRPGLTRDGRFDEAANETYLAQERGLDEETLKRLSAIDRARLEGEDTLSYDIFKWDLADDEDEVDSGTTAAFTLLPVNQFDGFYLGFAREMERAGQRPYARARDYDDAIKRMLDFTHRVDRAIAEMREGMARGITQPRVIVARMIAQLDAITAPDPDKTVFMSAIQRLPANLAQPERTRITDAWRVAVEDELIPSYRKLADFLKSDYLPKARDTIGLSALAHGRAMYLHLVRSQTSEDLAPDAIHAMGLKELQRIEGEETQAMKATGFTGTLNQFRAYLRSDPRFKFKDPAAMKTEFDRVRDTALAHLSIAFLNPPHAKVEFRFYESYAAPEKPAAEYTGPSRDGRRPGTVYLNDSDLPSRPTYTSQALELHEGIPGHHLQVALASENRSLPAFRRFGGETAYVEGWALYAESLGPELGLYTDPYQKFGELTFDAWRASRLVVDTGIHWLGWSRQQAVDFLLAHTTLSQAEAAEEVERYIALPAQALAYKIGEQEFLALRARAEATLGAKFSLPKFHDAVLKHGAMPLAILDRSVSAWIAQEAAAG